MRLLQRRRWGKVQLTEEYVRNAPRYAILSHTWGANDDEVSFKDMLGGVGRKKPGYRKIQFCERQTKADGMQYFWIDTCCIDKTNSTELSEAIVSMFQWYQNAAQCYVYLVDVPSRKNADDHNAAVTWEETFCSSRWFSRGWTLQELLAPQVVKFFSQDGQFLGDKQSLELLIHRATKIPVEALRGDNINNFSVEERLSWAAARQTLRKEDEAYCLQGLFGVYIPLIYGEGERAFLRLLRAIEEETERDSEQQRLNKRRKLGKKLSDQDNEILRSLSFPEMHNRRLNIDSRHQNSCEWILDLNEFRDWISRSAGLLWIKGKPGAGKSTLMAFLHDRYKVGETSTLGLQGIELNFFFSARGTELQRTARGMFRSLLNQLYLQDMQTRHRVRAVFAEKSQSFGNSADGWDWQTSELEAIFAENLLSAASTKPVLIFVDALDETGEESARHLAQYFHKLSDQAAKAFSRVKICISCRHYPIVTSMASKEVVVEDHNGNDIAALIHDSLQPYHAANSADQAAWQQLEADLELYAQGVFQWVRIVVHLIQASIDEGGTIDDVRHMLLKVPPGLKDIYTYILEHVIHKNNRLEAFLLFQWICLAQQPLKLTEVRYAMAMADFDFPNQRNTHIPSQNLVTDDDRMKLRIKSLSGGLVEIVDLSYVNRDYVQVGHQSVSDFMLTRGLELLQALSGHGLSAPSISGNDCAAIKLIQSCHAKIYWTCLHYLSMENVQDLLSKPIHSRSLVLEAPFIHYAIVNLLRHALKAGEYRCQNIDVEINVLQQVIVHWISFYRILDKYTLDTPVGGEQVMHVAARANMTDILDNLINAQCEIDVINDRGQSPLHLAVQCGHLAAAEVLITAGANINAIDNDGKTPLAVAARHGHVLLLRLLLSRGAQIWIAGELSGAALYIAAYNGHAELVKILIENGVDLDAHGGHWGNALQAASVSAFQRVIQILLDAGADVNAQGKGHYGNALQAACCSGSHPIVQQLLSVGADVNAKGGFFGNALQAASYHGHVEMFQSLLDKGADLNAQGGEYGNALQAAAFNGHGEIVRIVVDAGGDVNTKGGFYGNALQAAAYHGQAQVIQILLERGANVNAEGGEYGNALQAASVNGSSEIVHILLKAGAKLDVQGGRYGNSLGAASRLGHLTVVQTLLNAGTDINLQDTHHGSALYTASYYGHEDIVDILINAGADTNAEGNHYGTALQAASAGGCKAVVEILLHAGAEINKQRGHYGNALQAASSLGHGKLVQILLDGGANVNAQGGRYGNALRAASSLGHEGVVQILLDARAEINSQQEGYGTALEAASFRGHEKVVQLLVNSGADVQAYGGEYGYPLQAASFKGHEHVVRSLLVAGANVNARGGRYNTALEAAFYAGHMHIFQLLYKAGAIYEDNP